MYETNLQQFASGRVRTLSSVAHLSQQAFDFKLAANKWSVGEILDHLLLFDDFFRNDLQQLIDLARRGQPTIVRHDFSDFNGTLACIPRSLLPVFSIPFTFANAFIPNSVREAFVRNRRIPARHPDFADPQFGRPAEDLKRELADSMAAIVASFDSNSDLDFRRLRITQPLLGDNNVVELMRVLASHEQRHQGQIADVLSIHGRHDAGPRWPC